MMIPTTTRSTLLPYTTLFRSITLLRNQIGNPKSKIRNCGIISEGSPFPFMARTNWRNNLSANTTITRSEEHTSELQSHSDLVCRLLLEKKKRSKEGCKRV